MSFKHGVKQTIKKETCSINNFVEVQEFNYGTAIYLWGGKNSAIFLQILSKFLCWKLHGHAGSA